MSNETSSDSVDPGQQSIDMLGTARKLCFDSASDGDLPLPVRNEFSERGQILANQLRELTLKEFHEFTSKFKDLQKLNAINADLLKKTKDLSTITRNLANAQTILTTIDEVIKIGVGLVALV